MNPVDMSRIKNIHLIGIGGVGMSAIAKILFQMGYKVTGSDIKESSNTIRLKGWGIQVYLGHRESQIRGSDLVVYSSAIPKDNVELIEAEGRQIPIWQRAEMLAWIMNKFEVPIGISGTHGKTTTTSMISLILDRYNLDPTFLIGGEANDVDGNAKLGQGKYVVAEADESDGSFLRLKPKIAVVTNIEGDHLDFFGNLEKVIEIFVEYVRGVPPDGAVIVCSDQAGNKDLLKRLGQEKKIITYGLGEEARLRATNIKFDKGNSEFEVILNGTNLGEVKLSIPGMQNILNSLAALAVGLEVGLDFVVMSTILSSFKSVKRRFQLIGRMDNIMIVDDYAHHPTEVKATLEAAKRGWPEARIVSVFQPHRYTRTLYLHEEFGSAFAEADIVVLTDVYSAGEEKISGISGKTIAEAVERIGGREVIYIPKKEKIADYLIKILKPGDMVITAGAGDIYTVAKELLTRLKQKPDAS